MNKNLSVNNFNASNLRSFYHTDNEHRSQETTMKCKAENYLRIGSKPSTLLNIGPKVEEALAKLGIYTIDDFLQRSIYEIYFQMQTLDKKWKNKMLLYALFGAVNNFNCMMLDTQTKRHITTEYEFYINK